MRHKTPVSVSVSFALSTTPLVLLIHAEIIKNWVQHLKQLT